MIEEYPNTYEANKAQTLAGTMLTYGYNLRLMATARYGGEGGESATTGDHSLIGITFSV